jgi:hypothetical protein
MPRNVVERLRLIAETLALADERNSVAIADAAAELGVPADELRTLLEPVLFLEWKTPLGELHGESRAFLLTEDDHLVVTEGHWLRGLASRPPSVNDALRLFTAGIVAQAATSRTPSSPLDSALDKLADVLRAQVVVHVERPQHTDLCERLCARGRTLRMRYLSAVHGEPKDHEIEPHLVASRWGNWYVVGPIVGGDEMIAWRIDRILAAAEGDGAFEPSDVDLPEWFAMEEHERTVVVLLPEGDLSRLPQPNRAIVNRKLDDGRVEAEITVIGPRHLDHLLLTLPPDAEVTYPQEYAERRRDLARALLTLMAP